MDTILLIFWFVVGVVVSEYVQVISDRGSFIKSMNGRSHCDHCGAVIPWFALLPFIGAQLVGNKCVTCGKGVSQKYFWFELLFSATWAWSLYAIYLRVGMNFWIIALAFFGFCATSLIMYEDAKRFSVPVVWLIVSQILLIALWVAFGNRSFNFIDVVLLLAVVVASVFFVKLTKREELADFGTLFGSADVIAFAVAAGLLGFARMTVIISIVTVTALGYLFVKRRLKSGQKIPLLTLLSPLVYVMILVY